MAHEKPTLFDALNQIPRNVIRAAESRDMADHGTLENMLIYEEFRILCDSLGKRKKCEIYARLAERYGYGVTTIRNKIRLMASTDFPLEIVNNPYSYDLFLHLKARQAAFAAAQTSDTDSPTTTDNA